MRKYLPAVLTAMLLLVIVLQSAWLLLVAPAVHAQGGVAGIQFSRSEGALWFFDSRTGDLWIYDEARRMPLWHWKVSRLGAPLENISLTGKTAPPPREPTK